MDGTANWRSDLYAVEGGTLMTHAESIELFRDLGAKFTPELKEAIVDMPFDGYTTEDYAQAIVDEYKAAGIPASDVHLQTFEMEHMDHWLKAEPEFAATAVYLVDPDRVDGFDPEKPESWGEYAPQPLADMMPDARALDIERRDHMLAVGDPAFKRAVHAFLGEAGAS